MIRLLLLYFIWLRFQLIGLKPVHHDEAINGQFVQNLWANGFYNYDPNNYHGPLLIYLMGLSEKVFGWGIESLRLVPVVFSGLWLWFLFRWAGQRYPSSRWLTLVFASSSAFLFFSRSGIHEMVFVFFITLALAGVVEVLDHQNSRGWHWLLWGVWGCFGLKETWALVLISGAIAILLLGIPKAYRQARAVAIPKQFLVHLCVAVFLWIFLFTKGFSNFYAFGDFFKAFLPWTKTGVQGAGHEKPMSYWLTMSYRHELPLFLIYLSVLIGFFRSRKNLSLGAQFLGWAGFSQAIIYSVIPYKTPWCLLAVLGPICLFLVVAWKQVVASWTLRTFIKLVVLFVAMIGWSATWQLNFKTPTMPHDYVYVQTKPQLKVLMDHILMKAKADANLAQMKIQVAGTEPWPLAWWLMPFSNVQYLSVAQGLANPVDFLVVDAAESAQLESTGFGAEFYKFVFPIRDSRVDSAFYLRKSLFPEFPVAEMENSTP